MRELRLRDDYDGGDGDGDEGRGTGKQGCGDERIIKVVVINREKKR